MTKRRSETITIPKSRRAAVARLLKASKLPTSITITRAPKSVDFLNPREAAAARRAKHAAGVARAVKRLGRQLAEQLGKAPEFGVRTMKVREASTPVLKVDPRVLRDRAGLCTVEGCGAQVGAGGRKSAPAKCARCYQRERRGQVEAPRGAGELRDQKLTVSFTAHGRALLERQAASAGVSVSVFLERLVLGEPSGVAVDG